MIQIAQHNGLISRLTDHLIDGGCAILQYVDDTIMFIKGDMELVSESSWYMDLKYT
jgi:hypothetical protein